MQDEILTDLSKIADLKVISRTSVLPYKSGAARNLREIGKQLGVAHLLEGSVQRAANRSPGQRAVDRCPQRRASLGTDLRSRSGRRFRHSKRDRQSNRRPASSQNPAGREADNGKTTDQRHRSLRSLRSWHGID